MKPAELAHRVREFVVLKQLQRRHLVSPGWAESPVIQRFRFCSAAVSQLPDLPWDFALSQREIDDLLAGNAYALGFEWNWRPEESIWHQAPDTKKAWPKGFFGSINYREGNPYGDIRVAWQPSRLQQLIALALLANRQPEYSDQAVSLLEQQFLSWIEDNPPLTGIHYVSAMECALRIVVMSYALDIVRGKLREPERVWSALLQMVESHANLVEKRLSLYSSVGNHTMAECAGLIYAGILFPELDGAQRWWKRGLSLMEMEVDHQILQDGGGSEQALWYQLSVLDLCGLVWELLKRCEMEIKPAFEAAIVRGRRFLCTLARSPSRLPELGDCDSAFAFSPHLRLTWSQPGASDRVASFRHAGYTLMRGRDEEFTLLFDHGPLGMAPSYAHGHADALSVILSVGGREIFIDPGTYAYTGAPEWRAYFRGTRSHNTVTVDGRDQAKQETAFLWSQPFQAGLVKYEALADGTVRVLARHDGYRDAGVLHWRGVAYHPSGMLLIWDYLDGDGAHDLELHWHLDAGLAGSGDDAAGLSELRLPFRLDIRGGAVSLLRGQTNPICGWKSAVYGVKEAITTVRSRYTGALPHEFVTRVEWGHNVDGAFSQEELATFRQWAQ